LFGFLLALLLLVGVFMSVVVLLQSGKGGGLASMGGTGAGTDTLIGGRQAATLLTKATWVSGGLFLALALLLSIMSSRQTTPQSILRGGVEAPVQTAPQPLTPGATPLPGAGTQAPPATTTTQP
jgi:preprotein translocase subunit SecG